LVQNVCPGGRGGGYQWNDGRAATAVDGMRIACGNSRGDWSEEQVHAELSVNCSRDSTTITELPAGNNRDIFTQTVLSKNLAVIF